MQDNEWIPTNKNTNLNEIPEIGPALRVTIVPIKADKLKNKAY